MGTRSSREQDMPLQSRRTSSDCDQGSPDVENAGTRKAAHGDPQAHTGLPTVMLPRMPAGLSHIPSQAKYEAVANVARTAGHMAHLAGGYARWKSLPLTLVHAGPPSAIG
jgi:hypothetical protein